MTLIQKIYDRFNSVNTMVDHLETLYEERDELQAADKGASLNVHTKYLDKVEEVYRQEVKIKMSVRRLAKALGFRLELDNDKETISFIRTLNDMQGAWGNAMIRFYEENDHWLTPIE